MTPAQTDNAAPDQSEPAWTEFFSVGALTDIGRRRSQNQDSLAVNPELGLFMVADGMGGHQGGETASAMAVEIVPDEIRRAQEMPNWDPHMAIKRAIVVANDAIFERANRTPQLRGMGTTTTALLFKGDRLVIGHVGDSRCYFFRPVQNHLPIWQATRDHSLVQEKLRAGIITRAEIRTDRMKNVITRSVGYEKNVDVETYEIQVRPGDVFLICSDGLTGPVEDEAIQKHVHSTLAIGRDINGTVKTLIDAANQNGGDDNITSVVIQVRAVKGALKIMLNPGNKYYTVMIVPEKTSQVKRLVVPAWMVRTSAVALAFVVLLGAVMFFDYWSVMSQISENKQLKMENRRLRQQVQVFNNKVATIESTMDRVKTFATRLKVITNVEDRGGLLQSLNNGRLPDASTNIGPTAGTTMPTPAAPTETTPAPVAAAPSPTPPSENPENEILRREYSRLDDKLSEIHQSSLYVEQMLQDQYELLADQRSFLAALPTRKPVVGYYTSGFGVRHSPLGDGRVKMHEGVDIANALGTIVHAPADGVVTFAGIKAGYGSTLVIDHGYGLETWYGHTKKLLVSKGQRIKKGDSIALLGNTGRSTGPHLHYEVRVHGTPIDPLSYILEDT